MNQNIGQLGKSVSAELISKANQLRESGLDIIGLAGGEPDFNTPDSIKNAAINALLNNYTHYDVGKGRIELRKKIAEKLNKINGIKCDCDQIIITPGAKFAIYLSVRALVEYGDEVMILNPAWVSYSAIVKSANAIPVFVNLECDNDYRISLDKLESACSQRTKLLIINTPNNPTGRVLSEQEAIEIEKFLEKHNNIYLISDEIYEDIVFDQFKNISMASKNSICDRVITISGFSKSYAMTGWRIGFLQADRQIIESLYNFYVHTLTGMSPFIQIGALTAMDCNIDLEKMQQEYLQRRNYFCDAINQINNIYVKKPEGTFYAWIDIRSTGKESEAFANYLLTQAHVLCVPGNAYGEAGKGFIRMSFANKMLDLKKAIQRIQRVL